MKILYLAHRIPYPPNKGDKIRSFNQLKYLGKNHDLDLISFTEDKKDLAYIQELKNYCKKISITTIDSKKAKLRGLTALLNLSPISSRYFHLKDQQKTMDSWIEKGSYDAIICFCSSMAEYIFKSKKLTQKYMNSKKQPLLIMDYCDLDSHKWRDYSRSGGFPFNLVYLAESRFLFEYEKKINKIFDHSVFVSRKEADLFKSLFSQAKNLSFIENGVDFEFFSSGNKKKDELEKDYPVLVFTGAMDYYANIDGVLWFANEIFPEIKKRYPNTKFYIAGSNPSKEVKNLEKIQGIIVTGFVEDIREYYEKADISVVPLRIARGIQNKVLEAMSMGNPVVTTDNALLGIDAEDGVHLLRANSQNEFSDSIINLLEKPKLMKKLGENARERIRQKYSWQSKMEKFKNLLKAKNRQPGNILKP